MSLDQIKDFLDAKYEEFNTPNFIPDDPISIPHQYDRKEDIEISGLLSSLIAWGRRDIIIRNANRLMERMGGEPYEFVMHASKSELGQLEGFVHRTFNVIDATAMMMGLRNLYTNHGGLESAFSDPILIGGEIKDAILNFRRLMSETPEFPQRTHKHLANPAKGSSAKRINMYLRWMVRKDRRGVDFGIWKPISPSLLICPLDVHTGNVGRKIGLLTRKQNDWKAATELTENLRKLDPQDPVKYDFSLFGLGVYEGF